MEKNKTFAGYLLAIMSAVIYGLMPLMAKYIYADGVNPLTLVFLRNLLALPSLAVLALIKSKSLKIQPRELPKLGIISLFGCCITPILLFSSYRFIETGTATVFHFVYPSLVVIIGALFLKKKMAAATVISTVLCFAGVCFFYDTTATLDISGAALALASGLTFAVYVVLLSRYKGGKGALFGFYVALMSAIFSFIICLVTGSFAFPQSLGGWLLCAVFAFAVTTLAVMFFQTSTFIIGGEKTSILSVLEPITGIAVGFAVFKETVSVNVLIGSVLVIAASVIIAIADIRKAKKEGS